MPQTVEKFFYPLEENYERKLNVVFACGKSVPVFDITGLHTLIQLYGYAKFINRTSGVIFLRGQGELYSRCLPSYFRTASATSTPKAKTKFGEVTKNLGTKQCFKSVPKYAIEPLLQHYGVKTTWVDVVDNIWVALWFGINRFRQKPNTNYFNYEPRDETNDDGSLNYFFLLFFTSDALEEIKQRPGMFRGPDTRFIDIRRACPSTFHRPHIQHALLMKRNSDADLNSSDLMQNCVGIARIRVSHATKWLGQSLAFSTETLFPSPFEDSGLQHMISNNIDAATTKAGLGCLHFR